jgi:hypothetical protein
MERGTLNPELSNAARYSLILLFTFLDQLPEAGVLLQLFVLCHWQFRPEEKIPDGVFVQDAMHEHAFRTAFKINPVVIGAIPIETFPFSLDDPERFGIKAVQIVRQKLKLGKQLQLDYFWNPCNFGCTDFIENDLVHRVRPLRLAQLIGSIPFVFFAILPHFAQAYR